MPSRKDLLERNGAFAADFTGGELPIQPRYRQLVLSCVDARTDPAHYLGLEPGDALVMRTLGGRVTDGAEEDIAVLANLMTVIGGPDGPRLDVLIVHHTDCGLERLADEGRRTKLSQMPGSMRACSTHSQSTTMIRRWRLTCSASATRRSCPRV